jgi:D-3-phosphoglycerate dehydrogenase / 2-oxoglutarate reductase
MSKKVLVTPFAFHRNAVERLEAAGFEVVFTPGKLHYANEELVEHLRTAIAFIAGSETIDRELLDQAPRLKIIARFGVGYDAVDWVYANSKGIEVTLTIGTNEQSVAEMVFAHLLGLARKINYFDRAMRDGLWTPHILGHEIWQKTMGIIGTGRIGKAVARRASGFEMKVLAYDPYPDQEWANKNNVAYVSLDELIRSSDYISLHAPADAVTSGMVNESFLSQMKPTAYLINTARGKLIDEEALYQALANQTIAGAGLDVYQIEPCMASNKLLQLDNCTSLSSHVSSHTYEAMERMSHSCAEEVIRVGCDNEAPLYPIPGSGGRR